AQERALLPSVRQEPVLCQVWWYHGGGQADLQFPADLQADDSRGRHHSEQYVSAAAMAPGRAPRAASTGLQLLEHPVMIG
ncbi:hypothetical protein ABTE36_23200, partial [Acinetobacter baumannii]